MLKTMSVGEFTPKDEIENRIERFKRKMEENNIAFSIILQNVDLFYFTGTLQKGVLVIPIDGEPIFFVEKTLSRAIQETPLEVTPIKKDKDVENILRRKNILKGTGGMEFDVLPVAVFERWKGILGFDNLSDVSSLIKATRIVKSPFEIAQIIKSGQVVSHVFSKARDVIKLGAREVDISAALEAEGRKYGHQGFLRMRGLNQEMMNMYVTHGHSAIIPSHGDVPISGVGVTHAIAQGPSINRIARDIPVIIDYGGGYNGYVTDETRVFVVGELNEIFKKAYNTAREIIEYAMDYGREGINAVEIFNGSLDRAKRAGMEDYFMGYAEGKVGFIGHGIGLEINELPVITPRHNIILKEGMVFAFEPKFIIPGQGAIGIEVDFIVRQDRLERVTDTSIDVVYI